MGIHNMSRILNRGVVPEVIVRNRSSVDKHHKAVRQARVLGGFAGGFAERD
jgi:hypothetical protein